MTESNVKHGVARFRVDSHLLEELGERLVTEPAVAVAELIKNAYDADATKCFVWFENDKTPTLTVADNGHGMTERDFLTRWMTIATEWKINKRKSKRFLRILTGAKGVGRFAAKFLGSYLSLTSTAFDEKKRETGKLEADFDWNKFMGGMNVAELDVPFQYTSNVQGMVTGTILKIRNIRFEWSIKFENALKEEVLDICSPLPSLDSGPLAKPRVDNDPGFIVHFCKPGEEGTGESELTNAILDRKLAQLKFHIDNGKVHYLIKFSGAEETIRHSSLIKGENLIGDLYADILFIPWRKGQFTGIKGFKGNDARNWVKKNSGVHVYDHGFKIKPYGEKDDDWLSLSTDKARNAREWRSLIAKKLFPKKDQESEESLTPFLKLAANHQLVGGVFLSTAQIKSSRGKKGYEKQLQPAMDRQGYLHNAGYVQLVDIVRGGIELLAVAYREYDIKEKNLLARKKKTALEESIEKALKDISTADIPEKEKRKLHSSVQGLQRQYRELDEAHLRARQSIELMGLLGALVGFLTHETRGMFRTINELIHILEQRLKRANDVELKSILDKATQYRDEINDQMEYVTTFIGRSQPRNIVEFNARSQVQRVISKMNSFTNPRDIKPVNNVDGQLVVKTLPALYSGIVLNLYSNAIKAILAVDHTPEKKIIMISAENEGGFHILSVSDTGVGVPGEVKSHIFEPLFTTTSDSPLGGMGLGLSIVKDLVKEYFHGSIELASPPEGFSTCFRVRLKLSK